MGEHARGSCFLSARVLLLILAFSRVFLTADLIGRNDPDASLRIRTAEFPFVNCGIRFGVAFENLDESEVRRLCVAFLRSMGFCLFLKLLWERFAAREVGLLPYAANKSYLRFYFILQFKLTMFQNQYAKLNCKMN